MKGRSAGIGLANAGLAVWLPTGCANKCPGKTSANV